MVGPFDEKPEDFDRLTLYTRDFIKRYEPEERRYRLDFERDLHFLIHLIYAEAQRPLLKTLSDFSMHTSLFPPTIEKTK